MNKPAMRLATRGLMVAAALAAVLPLAAQSPVGDWALLSQTIDTARTRATTDEKRECERRDAALRNWMRIQQDRQSKPDATAKAQAAHQEAAATCNAARERRAQADGLWERLNSAVGKPCERGTSAACPQAELAAELFGSPAPRPPADTRAGTARSPDPAASPAPTVKLSFSPASESARVAASTSAALTAPAATEASASAAESAASAAAPNERLMCKVEKNRLPLDPVEANKDEPSEKDFRALMTKAATAQARVRELKQLSGDVFSVGDGAAKAGLDAAAAAELRLEGNRTSRQVALNRAEQGSVAFDAAFASKEAIGQAQTASNTLVRCSLQLAVCRLDGHCKMPQKEAYENAVVAERQLDYAIKEGEAKVKSAKAESRKQELAGLAPEQAERHNRYLDLLDKNPNAKALVGDDAALISASQGKTEGVIRLSLARLGFDNARRLSLLLSAPLNNGEATVAERRADRLSARPKVTLAWNGVTLLDKPNALISYGLTATIGRGSQTYIDPTKPEQLKLGTKPRGLGLTATLIRDERGLHTLGVERQRTWEPGKAGVVCPLPATDATSVRCLSGSLGMPTQVEATVSTYSYRRKTTFLGDALGLGIEATYNDKSREFDLGIPIYFIQGSGETKNELNAGIRIGLVNKRDPANGRDTSFGLFVSSPFKIGGN
jgi:hypothetical protein